MQTILYTTDCGRCIILKDRLDKAGVEYETVKDIEIMIGKGIKSAPILEIDGEQLDFEKAIVWVLKQAEGKEGGV